MRVDVERVLELQKQLKEINRLLFHEIELYENGEPLVLSDNQKGKFSIFYDSSENVRAIEMLIASRKYKNL